MSSQLRGEALSLACVQNKHRLSVFPCTPEPIVLELKCLTQKGCCTGSAHSEYFSGLIPAGSRARYAAGSVSRGDTQVIERGGSALNRSLPGNAHQKAMELGDLPRVAHQARRGETDQIADRGSKPRDLGVQLCGLLGHFQPHVEAREQKDQSKQQRAGPRQSAPPALGTPAGA